MSVKHFKLQYTDVSTGEKRLEEPRLMISIDGKEKSLIIGENIRVAVGDSSLSEEQLWTLARLNMSKVK